MKWLIIAFFWSLNSYAADFTINITPAPSSVGDTQVSSISSSKIINFANEVMGLISSSLSSYILKSEIPNCSNNQFLVKMGDSFSCQPAIASVEPLENLIINGDFSVKNRFLGVDYLNTTPMPPLNVYITDRWRTVNTGAPPGTYSLNTSSGVMTLASLYPIRQTIEGQNIIGGIYTLSWSGTASCKIAEGINPVGGTSGISPITSTLTAGADVSIDCSGGTLSKVQLTKGAVVVPFQKRSIAIETMMAARYYESGSHAVTTPGYASGALGAVGLVSFTVEKRAIPSEIRVYGNGLLNKVRNSNTGAAEGNMVLGSSTTKGFAVRSTSNLSDGVQYSYDWQADADFQ